jgi:hypothetical protein
VNARIGTFLGLGIIVTLAACGGGGGGSGYSSSVPPVGQTTAPTTAPTSQPTSPSGDSTAPPVVTNTPSASTDAVEGQEAQLAMSYLGGLGAVNGAGSVSKMLQDLPGSQTLAVGRSTAGALRRETVTCANQQTLTSSVNSEGQTTYVLQAFYDAACTQLEYEFDAAFASYSSGATISGSGHQAFYVEKNGQAVPVAETVLNSIYVTGYKTATPTVIVRGTAWTLVGTSTSSLAFGAECAYVTSGKSPGAACGNGMVLNSDGAAIGLVLGADFANGSLSSLTVDQVVAGSVNSLTLSGNAPASSGYYSIAGGTAGTAKFSASGSTITISDGVYTETVSFGATGIIGTLATGGKTVSTFTTDAYGTGSIKYSTGDTAAIADFLIL